MYLLMFTYILSSLTLTMYIMFNQTGTFKAHSCSGAELDPLDLRVKHTSDSKTGKMTLLLFRRGALDQEIINLKESA